MAAAKQLLRMERGLDDQMSWGYRIIRAMFQGSVGIFYPHCEVVGADNLPPPGNAAILCPNHGNSLTDAVVCVSQTPRFVRLTAKDTLFNIPGFGLFVRNVGTIPLQRKDEHEGGVDNSGAVSQLQTELLKGQMVCLFPEGRSRFTWKIDPLKYGVANIAYAALLQAKKEGKKDFTLSLCPAAFNYVHREKFRSALVVEYGPPVVYSPSHEVLNMEDSRKAVQRISEEIHEVMSISAHHAEDWGSIRIAHTARNLFAPLGTTMSLPEFVKLTKYWGAAVSVNDPRDRALWDDLSHYQDRLEALGLKDQRISREPESALYIAWCMLLRLFQIVVLAAVCSVGTLLWTPVFFLCVKFEATVMKRKKKPTHVDEVAQYKILIGVGVLPIVVTTVALLLTHFYASSYLLTPVLCLVVGGYMWITLRILEDLIASCRSLIALKVLLFLPRATLDGLRQTRAALVPRVRQRAEMCGGVKAPAVTKHGFWSQFIDKFNIMRRRKKDWNEVLRLREVLPVDHNALSLERQRSGGLLRQNSSFGDNTKEKHS
eukprot:TRINITY_DN16583_c0_g1_i1.p1 TRINITY_DN16583_c0_g1~~TRINITY_DN16583_c0_g1_i1.p1  ORF type:complete len:597 (+),score=247.03 TRINITY_DN16583_c0_g1_i1:163-1791(+)